MKKNWKNLLNVLQSVSTALVFVTIAIGCFRYEEVVPIFLIVYTIFSNIVINIIIEWFDVNGEKEKKRAIWYTVIGILLQIVFIVILMLM